MLGSCFMSWFLNAYNYFVNLTVIPVKKILMMTLLLMCGYLHKLFCHTIISISYFLIFQIDESFNCRQCVWNPNPWFLLWNPTLQMACTPSAHYVCICIHIGLSSFFFLWGGGTKHKSFIHITAGLPIIFPLSGLECNYLYWSIYAVLLTWLSCQ